VYRDHLYAAECRRGQLERACGDIPLSVVRVFARRQARVWAGIVGVLGASALVVSFALRGSRGLSEIVVASWIATLVTYFVGRGVSGAGLLFWVRRRYRPSGDPLVDLTRLEDGGPRAFVLKHTQWLEGPSLAYPLLAVSLLGPLSIHLLLAVGLVSATLGHFDGWIALSLVVVGHAHLTLAAFAVLPRQTTAARARQRHTNGGRLPRLCRARVDRCSGGFAWALAGLRPAVARGRHGRGICALAVSLGAGLRDRGARCDGQGGGSLAQVSVRARR
jgi:hypothetical protein